MKSIFQAAKISCGLLLLMIGFGSCKKEFLEVTPRGRLIAEKLNDYSLMLNNNELLNMTGTGQVLLGDEVAGLQPFFNSSTLREQRFFRWEAEVYQRDEDAPEITTLMKNLYTYNKIINEVMDAKDGTEAQKKAIRAEALGGRAWSHFILANYFGKPYNAATSSSDPGFPIITDADVTKTNFQRATVQEVYDFIIADLKTAISDLPANITHRLRMARPAAEALLGKVYVFMGRPAEATPLFNSAISGLAASSVPTRLYDHNVTFAPGGAFLPIGAFGPASPTAPNYEESLYGKQTVLPYTFTSNALIITPATVNLFASDDHRLKFYRTTPVPSGAPLPAGTRKRLGPTGAQWGVVLPDVYLLRAESKARNNDIPGAVADLEFFRKHRMPVASAVVPASAQASVKDLLTFIMEERTREFAVQGFRWFDMRRLSVDPLFGQKTFTHIIYADDGTTTSITSTPERLTMRLPEKLIDQNPGMQNNP